MIRRTFILFAPLLLLTACDIPRPGAVVCDCQVNQNGQSPRLTELSQAPENFDRTIIRSLFKEGDSFDETSEFEASNIHWYQEADGETIGCVVFESTDHVRAIFRLSADTSNTSPVEYRLMGIPFGHRSFSCG